MGGLSQFVKHSVEFFFTNSDLGVGTFGTAEYTPVQPAFFCAFSNRLFFVKAPFWCFFRSAFLVLIRFLYETIYTLKLVDGCCLANCFFQLRTAVSLKTKSAYNYGDEYHKTGT